MRDTLADRLVRGVWREQCSRTWVQCAPGTGDAVMGADLSDRFHAKQGRSIARWRLGELTVYLKRQHRARLIEGLIAALFPFRGTSIAAREAGNLRWAESNGFRVPRIAAFGECIGPRGQLRSYLAIEELAGMLPLHEAIPLAQRTLCSASFQRWKSELVASLAGIVRRLHGLKRFHKDLYLCHFYIAEKSVRTGSGAELAMIDLHRLGWHPLAAAWYQMKDLAQLLYSSDVDGVDARDRLRFARIYAGESRRSRRWRFMRRIIAIRWRNYRRHNLARRANRAA